MARLKIVHIEDKYTSVKQLIELGKQKHYLLYDEIYEVLPDEVIGLPGGSRRHLPPVRRAQDLRPRPAGALRQPRGDRSGADRDFDKKESEEHEVYAVDEHEKTNDPVRMYLREMGTVPLLDREGEVEIAQRIEQGEWLIYEALCENPLVLRELLRLNELAQKDKRVLRELVAATIRTSRSTPRRRPDQAQSQIFDQIAKLDREVAKLAASRPSTRRAARATRSSRARPTAWSARSPRRSARSTSRCRRATAWSTT